jgi:phage/conjugal plasmid C-4 type zinc finger TraR family protein
MAGGWTRDGAVNDQIEASTQEELARLRARTMPVGDSFEACADCGEDIPEARRVAVPGVKRCIECQSGRDHRSRRPAAFNRRGSKDSQLK